MDDKLTTKTAKFTSLENLYIYGISKWNFFTAQIKVLFKYKGKYLYLYLNTVLTKVFAIVFVFGKFIVFVFVFKYYAMYLDPSLIVAI